MTCGFTESWNDMLATLPARMRDVYFTENYVGLYASSSDRPMAFYYRDVGRLFLLPFLRREVELDGRKYFDFETAYGYGGPVSSTPDASFNARAMEAFTDACRDNGFVAGFLRFHPLLNNQTLCAGAADIIHDRNTVAIDLRPSLDDVWLTEIHTKNRNVIKKAIANGLTFEADYDFNLLDDFCRLYAATMDKLEADSFYYFSPEYFRTFKERIPQSFLGLVKHEGRTVAAAIFMWDGPWGHYHLSGSDRDALRLFPNNLLLWGAAGELKGRGVEVFHLGGGTDSSADNSLFAFKRKFSHSLCGFNIGKMVFKPEVLARLNARWEELNPSKALQFKNHLLKYRY